MSCTTHGERKMMARMLDDCSIFLVLVEKFLTRKIRKFLRLYSRFCSYESNFYQICRNSKGTNERINELHGHMCIICRLCVVLREVADQIERIMSNVLVISSFSKIFRIFRVRYSSWTCYEITIHIPTRDYVFSISDWMAYVYFEIRTFCRVSAFFYKRSRSFICGVRCLAVIVWREGGGGKNRG